MFYTDLLREGRCTNKINANSFSPYNVHFSGFKSAINIRQMYFMNPLKLHGVKEFHTSTVGLNSFLFTSLNFNWI